MHLRTDEHAHFYINFDARGHIGTMALNEKTEEIAMMIISNAGAARGAAFDALKAAKAGDFDRAEELLKSAEEFSRAAHKTHSELLKLYANGEVEGSDILISHAQDHLMSAALALELIDEIIDLRKTIQQRTGKEETVK